MCVCVCGLTVQVGVGLYITCLTPSEKTLRALIYAGLSGANELSEVSAEIVHTHTHDWFVCVSSFYPGKGTHIRTSTTQYFFLDVLTSQENLHLTMK